MTPTAWFLAIIGVVFGFGVCVGAYVTFRLVKWAHQTEALS